MFNIRAMTVWQKVRDSITPAKVIPRAELPKLLFGQQHMGKQVFFETFLDQTHTIELAQFPHYIFLRDHLNDPFSDHAYALYLSGSWSYAESPIENSPENKRAKIET